jgi:hypothetical protein
MGPSRQKETLLNGWYDMRAVLFSARENGSKNSNQIHENNPAGKPPTPHVAVIVSVFLGGMVLDVNP